MFNFLGSIVGKIASAMASVLVAVGLISAPTPEISQPVNELTVEIATSTPIIEAEEKVDVKAELDALKKQLADEQKKRKDLEKKIVAPAPVPKSAPTVVNPPAIPVVVTPLPTPAPTTPTVSLLPGQFLMPNGAIVNSLGIIIKAAPVIETVVTQVATTTPPPPPPPPPAPIWPPTEGSTVDIKQSMLSAMNFNNHLTCDQLALVQSISPSKKDLCILYKEKQDKYTWNIIQDI